MPELRSWVGRFTETFLLGTTSRLETYGIDVNQVANFDLGSGREAYVKIVSSPSWYQDGDKHTFERPTFYAWLIPNDAARPDVAHLTFYGGS
jgi:hypothetical protein